MGGYDEESLEASSTASYASELSSPPRSSGKKVAGEDGEPLRPIAGNTPMEIFAGGIAAASVASAAAAMILQPVNVVFAAGGLSWYVVVLYRTQCVSSFYITHGVGLFPDLYSQSHIIFLSAISQSAIGPYAYWQQRRLTDVIALQETHRTHKTHCARRNNQYRRIVVRETEAAAIPFNN